MIDLAIEIAGERVLLMPERALFHPAAGTLYISDLHLGKHATFRALGVPLPGGSAGDMERLSRAVTRSGAKSLIILGDLMNATHSRDRDTLATFVAWREQHAALPILLVRGNHDRSAGDPPGYWGITCVDPPYIAASTPRASGSIPTTWEAPAICSPFTLVHDPDEAAHEPGFALGGHLHPAAMLQGRGRDRIKLPCFWQWPRGMIMPAFSTFAAGTIMPRRSDERMYAVTDNQVFEI